MNFMHCRNHTFMYKFPSCLWTQYGYNAVDIDSASFKVTSRSQCLWWLTTRRTLMAGAGGWPNWKTYCEELMAKIELSLNLYLILTYYCGAKLKLNGKL